MDFFKERTLLEFYMSTADQNCHSLGGGRFEFCLNGVEWPENCSRIGLKCLELPKTEKTVRFKYAVCGFYEEPKTEMIKSGMITYNSYEELACVLESILLKSDDRISDVCMNFNSKHSKHLCSMNGHGNETRLCCYFAFDRFFLRKSSSLRIFFSQSILDILRLSKDYEKIHSSGLFELVNCSYVSEKIANFTGSNNQFCIVVYDILGCFSVFRGGERYSIMFNGKVEPGMYGQDELICIKRLNEKIVRKFVCGFFDSNMQPFRPKLNFALDPIKFVFVIMS